MQLYIRVNANAIRAMINPHNNHTRVWISQMPIDLNLPSGGQAGLDVTLGHPTRARSPNIHCFNNNYTVCTWANLVSSFSFNLVAHRFSVFMGPDIFCLLFE